MTLATLRTQIDTILRDRETVSPGSPAYKPVKGDLRQYFKDLIDDVASVETVQSAANTSMNTLVGGSNPVSPRTYFVTTETNAPIAGASNRWIVKATPDPVDADRVEQIATLIDGGTEPRIFRRRRSAAGTWGSWLEFGGGGGAGANDVVFYEASDIEAATIDSGIDGILLLNVVFGNSVVLKRETSAPSHDGYWISDDGAYWVVTGQRVSPEWFRRGSATDATCWTRAGAYLQAKGGGVLDTYGKDYSFGASVTIDASYVTIYAEGSFITQNHNSGVGVILGNGSTLRVEVVVIGGRWDQINSCNQYLFEIRGIRNVDMFRVKAQNIYQYLHWGRTADTQFCYQLWENACECNMRSGANGGHSHGYVIENSTGGWHRVDCKLEGYTHQSGQPSSTQTAIGVSFPSTFVPARFDEWNMTGGIIKGFQRGLYVNDSRLVNTEWNGSVRIDDTTFACIHINATASGKGADGCRFRFSAGGFPTGYAVLIEASASTTDVRNLLLDVVTRNLTADIIQIVATNSAVIGGTVLIRLHAEEYAPDGNNTRNAVIVSGTCTECFIETVVVSHISSNKAAYGVARSSVGGGRINRSSNIIGVFATAAASW
jgi:hypothetical protein